MATKAAVLKLPMRCSALIFVAFVIGFWIGVALEKNSAQADKPAATAAFQPRKGN